MQGRVGGNTLFDIYFFFFTFATCFRKSIFKNVVNLMDFPQIVQGKFNQILPFLILILLFSIRILRKNQLLK